MTKDVQLKRRLFIFVVVRGCIKATATFMLSSLAPRNLFHVSMWVVVLTLLAGCHTAPDAIEVEGVELPDSFRETQWMNVLNTIPQGNSQAKQLSHLQHADSAFWTLWCEDILQLGPAEDTATMKVLGQFLTDMQPMLEAIDTTSGQPEVIERESQRLRDGLKRMHVIDEDLPVPNVVWMPSGFNFAVYPTTSQLCIGLDWFMGKEHPIHAELPPSRFPAYRLSRMRPDRMATDALRGWLAVSQQHRIPNKPRAVDLWLYWGKVMHVLSRCLPDASPAELMNWTQEEWEWAVAHERATWAEMQPQERMFSDQPREVMRWFQEGPFTRVGNIPQDSPDRLGIFLGWRAMQAALETHPEWTDRDVLEWTDSQAVLRAYRP